MASFLFIFCYIFPICRLQCSFLLFVFNYKYELISENEGKKTGELNEKEMVAKSNPFSAKLKLKTL